MRIDCFRGCGIMSLSGARLITARPKLRGCNPEGPTPLTFYRRRKINVPSRQSLAALRVPKAILDQETPRRYTVSVPRIYKKTGTGAWDMSLPWFRMYAEAIDDAKLRLLAFEDRWHFVAILCCKCQGVLDVEQPILDRRVAVKLGLQKNDLDEVRRRLIEAGLINDLWQPLQWIKRQFVSDISTGRVRKYRENNKKKTGNGDETFLKRTRYRTDTDTDTENTLASNEKISFSAERGWKGLNGFLAVWKTAYPAINIEIELEKAKAWLIANPANKKKNYARFLTNWFSRTQDRAPRKLKIVSEFD